MYWLRICPFKKVAIRCGAFVKCSALIRAFFFRNQSGEIKRGNDIFCHVKPCKPKKKKECSYVLDGAPHIEHLPFELDVFGFGRELLLFELQFEVFGPADGIF